MGCIYVLDGIEYSEEQLKEYLAKNLDAFSKELTGEDLEATGINKAANKIRRELLGMESYDPDVVTNIEANEKAEEWLRQGNDVNELLNSLEKGKPVSLVEQEVIKILNMELDAKIAENPTDELLAKQRRLTQINDLIGTEPARLLQARKGMPAPMSTISDYYIDKMNRNGVDVLTEKQKAEVKADFEEIQEANKKVEDLREKVNDAAAKELAQREIDEAKKTTKIGGSGRKKIDYAAERSKVIDDIRKKLKSNKLTAVPVPYIDKFIEISPDVAKLVRLFVEEGVEKLDDIVANIYDILKEEIGGVTKQDVQDMIAGKYSKPKPTKTELQRKVNDLRREAKILSEIENAKAGVPKTEKATIQKNQRIADLNKQLVKAREEAGYYDDDKVKKLERAVDKVNAEIAEFERKIKEGDYSLKPKKINILDDTELKRKNPELFDKLVKAREKSDALKFEYAQKMAREEINSAKGFQKGVAVAGKFTKEGINTITALKAGIDNSVVFIQNGLAVLNPMNIKATKKGLAAQLNVAFSESNFRKRLVEIHENKQLMELINKSGLDVIDPKGYRESVTNEQFGGQNWLEKLKFEVSKKDKQTGKTTTKTYKASMITSPFERIFAAFSNEFRIQIFLRGAEKLLAQGKTLENNIDDFKSLASYANNITGRGKVHDVLKGKPENIVSSVIWAPGLMSSSLNIMGLGDAVNLGKTKGYYRQMTPEVRKYAIRETSYGLAMGALIMGAMALDPDKEVDYDPESVTFGQVRDTKNGWSYNIFGRFTPYVRYLAMMIMRGKAINGKPVKFDAKSETYKFFRGKMAPFAGVATDVSFSENFQGKKYNLDDKGQIASDLFEPLFIKELREQVKIDGTEAILTRTIPSFMGIKVVNEKMYDKRDLKSLLNDTQVSSTMDKNLMVSYKEDENGKPVTKAEFEEFVNKRDELIGKYITTIYEKGVPVLEGENVVIKPITEVSKEELMKEINRLKTLATKNVKIEVFGEKPEVEDYLQEDLRLTREELGIGNPEQEQ